MGKKKKNKSKDVAKKTGGSPQASKVKGVLRNHPNFLPVVILFVLLLIFFNQVIFTGKTFLPPDKLSSESVRPFIENAKEEGIYPLWCPYIFCGMPSFASLLSAPYVDILGDLLQVVAWPIKVIFPTTQNFILYFFNYFLLAIFSYVLLLKKTGVKLIALFAAAAMVFQPPVIAFAAFGHGTKLATAALIPIMFLLLDELLDKRRPVYFALLVLAVGLQLLRAHTQMAYYTFMMMGLYILFWLIHSRVKKVPTAEISKSVAVVFTALVIGVAMSAWLYLPVQEYAHFSIRGGATGLDYGYATNWSFSPKEIITFFVPSFLGFGGQTYWGEMPFTDFPLYMGIVTLLLAGLALVVRRDKYVVFFTILGGLALIVSFGKHLPILYGPLFELLPFFNKFRVPNMILILLQFAVVVLAGLGLHSLIHVKDKSVKDKIRKYVYIFAGIGAVILLFLLAGKSIYLSWAAGSIKNLPAANQNAAYDKAAADGLKMILLLGAGAFLIIYYLKAGIKTNGFLLAITAVTILDLWWVGFQITDPKPQASKEAYFAETEAVKYIKQDQGFYRIYPVADDKPANWYMYYLIENVLGYHAAKLKNYQTFMEKTDLDARTRYGFSLFLNKYLTVAVNDGQPQLVQVPRAQVPEQRFKRDNAILDMLNVKYLISYYPFADPRYKPVLQGRPFVFENTEVLPRAHFVDAIKVMTNDDFFDYLNSGQFDPAREAILSEQPEFDIVPSEENRVEITSYGIHQIKLKADVMQPALLVLSEIYYPAGWEAYVDGEQTKIYEANTILRSILLKPGTHEIEFRYNSTTFKLGLGITLTILIGMLALLLYQLRFRKARRRVKEAQTNAA